MKHGIDIVFKERDRAETYEAKWPAVPSKGDRVAIDGRYHEVVETPVWHHYHEKIREIPHVTVYIKLL